MEDIWHVTHIYTYAMWRLTLVMSKYMHNKCKSMCSTYVNLIGFTYWGDDEALPHWIASVTVTL